MEALVAAVAVSEDEGAMHKNSGITKSFGGKMFESDWEVSIIT